MQGTITASYGAGRDELEARFFGSLHQPGQPIPRPIANLDDNDLGRIAARLDQLRNECGCSAGAVFLAVGMVAAVAYGLQRGVSGVGDAAGLAGRLLVAVLLFTAAGKVAAIALARVRWRIESRRARTFVSTRKGI